MSLEKMTDQDARTFETYSPVNAAIAESACANGCKAYVDVFTFNRWIAQGRAVRKGEHGARITTWRPIVRTDKATGERKVTGKFPRTSVVFCRCQTDTLREVRRGPQDEAANMVAGDGWILPRAEVSA